MSEFETGFSGTDRYRLIRKLGEGAMGVVYAAHDTHRDEEVALKTLNRLDPTSIYQIKKEFRTLADVVDDQLVALYDLVSDSGHWFFTMELLEGFHFLEYVRPDGLDEARARLATRQLAAGIATLHDEGVLHRDLKPSNVIVTHEGRAVILDFGISDNVATTDDIGLTAPEGVWGSPAYMAPEQLAGTAVPESDWYALGVMLFEALTGRLPFEADSLWAMLSAKTVGESPVPEGFGEGLPEDLVQLCIDLMAFDPSDRPDTETILQRLEVEIRSPRQAVRLPPGETVGQEGLMAALHTALGDVRMGEPVVALVGGRTGSGKSTLVDAFASEAPAHGASAVLVGRCYMRESVPFKGLEGVIDSLTQWLRGRPADMRAQLVDQDLSATARLFPALARLPGIPAPSRHEVEDAKHVRANAVAALRRLLQRIGESGPLVLVVDDLQWGDRDTAVLLEEVLRRPDAPPVLLVVAYRTEEIDRLIFLKNYVERARTSGAVDCEIGPLSDEEARELATRLLGPEDPTIQEIVSEAAGVPFLIEQLAEEGLRFDTDVGSTGELLTQEVSDLPAEPLRLLEILAVAGRPLDAIVARRAVGLDNERASTRALLGRRLLRPGGDPDTLEIYHERLRAAVLERIGPERVTELQAALARALESTEGTDPHTLFEHFHQIGEIERARRYLKRAAQAANDALAFDRAAALFGRAVELAREAGEDTLELEIQCAVALGEAGLGPESADAFLSAAERADEERAQELRRLAAEQLWRCGHIERGSRVAEDLLRSVGVRPATSSTHALIRLLARRARLRLRGLDFDERSEEAIPQETIQQLDVSWGVSLGLALVDSLRAADAQVQHLHLAVEAGEPYRVSRALALESVFAGFNGERERAWSLVERATELAYSTGRPHAIGIAGVARSVYHHYFGEFGKSVEAAAEAEHILRTQCTGTWWEVDMVILFSLASLYYGGRWDELARRVPLQLSEALNTGNRYVSCETAGGRAVVVWLMRDDVPLARQLLGDSVERLAGEEFHTPHWWNGWAEAQIQLYEGDADRAREWLDSAWSSIRKAMILRIKFMRSEVLLLRGRLAVAGAASAANGKSLLTSAARDAQTVLRARAAWTDPQAGLILAAIEATHGRDDACVTKLREVLAGFERTEMEGYTAATRWHLGRLTGGEEGRELMQTAESWFEGVGVKRPEAFCNMLAPGLV